MKQYELTVLLHPDLEVDLEKSLTKLEKIIADYKGEVTNKEVKGKAKLAYSIAHQDHAIYVYYDLNLPLQQTAKLQSVLNITDEIIRYLLVAKDLKAPVDDKAEEDKSAKAMQSDDKADAKED